MLKKFAAVVLAAAVMAPGAAFAEEIGGVMSENGIAVITDDKTRMVLNGYDENGRLVSSGMFTSDSGEFIVPSEFAEYRLRASFFDGEIYDVGLTADEPAETDAPLATQAPEATASPKPTSAPSQKYPSIYDKQIDAIDAIAVVDKVLQGANDNSEPFYYVNVLYQGEEMSLAIEENVTITESSDEFAYMTGQSVSSLKKGDVICFTANLSGKIRNVGLVYRPVEKNIVTDGNDYGNSFEKLISKNGAIVERKDWSVMKYGGGGRTRSALAFGVISDKGSRSVTLLGADGISRNGINLDLKKDTIVYVCDMSARKELSIEGAGSIVKSSIPKSAEDEKGNIIYSDDCVINYALLRVVDGTVTDAVIYINYN